MANGSTKRGLRLRSVYVSGNGGTRTVTATLAGSSFTRSVASGSPDYQGDTGSLVLVEGGSSHYLTIVPSGSIRLGRGGGGSTSDGHALSESGTVGGAYALSQAPTAPTLVSVEMTGPVSARVTFAAPSDDGNESLTGYRIVYANNAGFSGATTLDVDTKSLTRVVEGLTPGEWFFKVAARNAVTAAAGSSSVFSSAGSVVLATDVGDLDGWEAYGTLPAGLTPLVGSGLRRGAVYPLGAGAPTGLLREIQCSGSGSVAAATVGIRRTFTGLVVGRTYKLNGTALSLQATTPPGNLYRFAVVGIGAGSNAATSDTTHPAVIPEYSFVATSTTHVVQIQLNEAAAWSGTGWFEAVAFYGLTLTEIPNASPFRLQDVALESSLANHFTIACDTVGAVWWVDSDDVTQFRQVPGDTAVRAIFTDVRAPGELEYIDLSASYDTRNVVNALEVRNHGRDAVTGNTRDADYSLVDPASVAAWGVRSGDVETCLRSGYIDKVNLIVNPSAEVDAAGWQPPNTEQAVTRQTTVAKYGAACLRARATASTAGLGVFHDTGAIAAPYPVTVVAGREYTFSVWVYTTLTGKTASARIRWANATTNVGTDTVGESVALPASTWTRVSVTGVAPVGATNCGPWGAVVGGTFTSGQDAFFDGMLLTEGGLVDYFDGSSPSDEDYVFAWSGTPHSSTATRTTWELLNARIAEIVANLKAPRKVVSSIVWNAQEDPTLAAALDVQDRIRVRFRGETADYRVVGIRHKITGKRWLMTLELAPS